MAGKNVVRTDVVQIRYDVDDSPLQGISREVNDMKNDVVKGVKSSDNALNNLQQETNQTGQKFREAGQDADKFKNKVKGVGDESGKASGLLGKLKDTIGGLGLGGMVAGAAGGLGIAAIFGSANDGVKALNQLQAQTGATKAEMQELGGIAKEVYTNNMGESLDDVVKSMATVKNTTGASGNELKGLTHNALLLRDTFDFDVNESVRSADMLMKQFGLSGDEAYNLIAQGAQLGLDKNGNLLDSFNEYSVHFKQLGLDSQDMMSIFANSAEQGVFDIDKIGDAVKEFGIRAIDGSKGTAEGFASIGLNADTMAQKFTAGGDTAKSAFQETVNALASMKDPVAQNAAGVALFGTMWEDLGPKAVLAMSTTNKKVNENKNALEGINAVKYDDATSALSALGRTINVAMADSVSGAVGIATELINGFTTGIKEAASFTKEHWGTIKPIIMGVAIALGAYLLVLGAYTLGTKLAAAAEYIKSDALKKSAAAMWANNTAMLASPMTWIVLGIIALIAAIILLVKNWDKVKAAVLSFVDTAKGYLSQFWTWITGIFSGIWTSIVNVWNSLKQSVLSFVMSVWTTVVTWFTAIKTFFMTIWTGIVTFLSGIWQSIWGVIGGAVMAIWGVISTIFSYIFQIIAAVMQGIWNKIVSVWTTIVSAIVGFLQAIWNFYVSIWSAIFSFIAGIMQSIWSKIVSVWSIVVSAVGGFLQAIWSRVTSVWNSIRSTISSILSGISSTISSIWSGIVSKIGSFLSNIWTKITTKFNQVLEWLRNLKDKFLEVGGNLIKGLLDGITNKMGDLKNKVKEIGDNVLGGVKEFFGIASPSKEFALIGQYNIQGLEQGMMSSLPSLRQTVSAIGETTLGSYSGAYTPENSPAMSNTSRSETNTYSPQFNLTVSGAENPRDIERKVKQWVREAMTETFSSFGRRNPRLREV